MRTMLVKCINANYLTTEKGMIKREEGKMWIYSEK